MNFRNWAQAISLCLAMGAHYPGQAQSPADNPSHPEKVLRYAFLVAETGFDPVQLNDLYSAILTAAGYMGSTNACGCARFMRAATSSPTL